MPEPIRIGLEALDGSGPWAEAGPMILAHFYRAGFAQYDPRRLRRNTTESKSRVTGGGPVASCQKPGPMIFAHWLNCFWTRRHSDRIRAGFVQHDPAFLCRKNGTESDAGSQIRHSYTIRPDSGCTLTVMAITGLGITKTLLNRIRHVYWGDHYTVC